MRTIVLISALLLTGCAPPPSEKDDRAQIVCLYGHRYGVDYFSHGRSIYPLFDQGGKPETCK